MRKGGFSLIELLFVIMIGGVLLAITAPQIGRLQARGAAINARDGFIWLASRGRAAAIQEGQVVTVTLDPSARRATARTAAGDTIDRLDFRGDYGASVTTSTGAAVSICYTPRGFADCPASDVDATFRTGADSASLRVRPLGQVEKK